MKNRVLFLFIIFLSSALRAQSPAVNVPSGWSFFSIDEWKKFGVEKKKQWAQQTINRFPALARSPFSNKVAQVRVGNPISIDEKSAIQKRMPFIEKKIREKFGLASTAPKIAVVASGGGLRASLAILGALSGMEQTGLLDTVLWASTLSGSTWGLGTWLQNKIRNSALSVEKFGDTFIQLIKDKYISTMAKGEYNFLIPLLLVNMAYDLPFDLVDLYGGYIANMLLANFGPLRQTQKLSAQVKAIQPNTVIPIYTAVSGHDSAYKYWYAYTPWEISLEPWEIGGDGFSIPTWAFGRTFENGVSTGSQPEMSLGFNFGTFGSAFAADLALVIENTFLANVTNPFLSSIVKKLKQEYGSLRLTAAEVFNFMKNMPASPFKNQETLKLVDGGLAFNLPFPPVSGMRRDRKADVIIIVDASGSLQKPAGAIELKKMERYANTKGIKLPKIDYAAVTKQSMSIFMDERDKSVPIIVYLPFIKDADISKELADPRFIEYKSLANFDTKECCGTARGVNPAGGVYDVPNASKVIKLMRFNVLKNQKAIWQAIESRAKKIALPAIFS